jgi:PAS domain S-box-containing protein
MPLQPGTQPLADVLESISDAFIALDRSWRFTYLNRAAEGLLRRGRDELMGRDVWAEFPEAAGSVFEEQYRRAVATGETAAFVEYFPPLDAWLEVRAYPTPQGLAVYFQNVSERKRMTDALYESEARFRQLADAMPQIVFTARPDGHVDYFNHRWYEYTGLPPGSVGFESWRQVHTEEGLRRVAEVWPDALRTGSPYEIEYPLRRHDGVYRWHLGRALPVRDAAGKVVRWFGTNTDIHDQKQAESRLREETEVVETINRVGRWIAAELDVERLVQAVTDATTQLTRAKFGAFFYSVRDARGKALSLYTLSGASREAFASFGMPRATHIFGPTMRGEAVIRLEDVTADPRYGRNAPHAGMPPGHLPVRSYLAVPVVSRSGEVIGALFFGHPEPGVFTERDERTVLGVAAQAAVAIDNARLYDALRASNAATERSLAQLRAVVGSMAEGVILADPQGNVLEWNRAALQMHGYAREDEARQHVNEFARTFELRAAGGGGGAPLPVEQWPMSRVLRGERFADVEVAVRRLDAGASRVIRYSGTPVRDAGGDMVLALLTLRDVTEERRAQDALRDSESRLQLAVSIAEMGTFQIDLRTDAVTVNGPGRAIYGWRPDEPLTFAKVQGHFHPDDRDEVLRRVAASFDPAGAGEFQVEQRIYRTDGALRWIRVRGRAVFDRADGERRAVRSVGTYIDVTEQKEVEQRRDQLLASERGARAEAERASRMKDEFLSTVSHELRTPLNAILGWSQLLRAGGAGDGEDLAQGLEVIERNARAQVQIIEDLLDMSRIISGKVRLDVQRVDLPAVIEAAVASMQPAADAKGIRLQQVLDPLAGPVSGDPNRLQQVIWNLLSNAVKFTPRGGRVRVVLERVNSHVEVSVSDTGEGITPDFLPHVFERFRQAEATTTRRHGGLGLGLSIVKQLVELHGGTVQALSGGRDTGATFRIALPLTPLHEQDDDPGRRHPTAGQATAAECAPARLAGLRVLVVEDDADARQLMQRVLAGSEAAVTTTGSADEAIARCRAERFDVVVSDIGMPGRDGYDFIRDLRQLPLEAGGRTPAVALTALARSQDRTRAMLAGFDMHVAKPVEPAELCAAIARLAGRAR